MLFSDFVCQKCGVGFSCPLWMEPKSLECISCNPEHYAQKKASEIESRLRLADRSSMVPQEEIDEEYDEEDATWSWLLDK